MTAEVSLRDAFSVCRPLEAEAPRRDSPTMRILVTGGHGFVGRHLVRSLLGEGHAVSTLYRHEGQPASLDGLDVVLAPGDLNDGRGLRAAVEGAESIFHLAGLTRSLTRSHMMRTNVGGTRKLVEAARQAGFAGRFLFCSSLAACAPSASGVPVDEESARPEPLTWYGESKLRAETIVREAASDFDVTIVRPPAVYGPGDRDFLTFFDSVAKGLTLIPGRADAHYSLVYVGDLAEALRACASSDVAIGRTYFAAHEEIVTLDAMVRAAEASVGRTSRRLTLPTSLLRLTGRVTDLVTQLTGRASLFGSQRIREIASAHWVCCSSKIFEDTGWRAATPIARGFPVTVASYRESGQLRI